MKIELTDLIPIPLVEIPHTESQVWEQNSIIIENNENVSFIAASGKGKTSLLSIIFGIRKDYLGEVLFDGISIESFYDNDWTEIRKKQLGYVFQGLELFDDLTALENIILKNQLTSYKTKAEIHLMAEEIGIEYILDKKVATLSFGQKQRVAIIRALCQEMDFLLADEIFSHLDKESTQKTFNLIISELKNQDAGLIITSLEPSTIFNESRILYI